VVIAPIAARVTTAKNAATVPSLTSALVNRARYATIYLSIVNVSRARDAKIKQNPRARIASNVIHAANARFAVLAIPSITRKRSATIAKSAVIAANALTVKIVNRSMTMTIIVMIAITVNHAAVVRKVREYLKSG